MKATVIHQFGAADVLTYGDWPKPEPTAGQVLIRTHAIGVNYADVHLRAGRSKKRALPALPGLEAAGEVVAVGEGVHDLRVGQRVSAYAAQGSYAEFVLAQANLAYRLPDGLSYESASCIGSGITAYNVLHLAGQLSASDVVVIHSAAGGVGSLCVQLAREAGARCIIGTVGSDAKVALVRELGADVVVNYQKSDAKEAILEATDGRGADLILDARGGHECEKSIGSLAHFGRMVLYGQSSGQPAFLQSNLFYKRNQAMLGYSSGHYRRHRPEALRHAATTLLQLLADGAVKNLIGGQFALADAAAAHRLLESRTSTGKLLLIS
ncbi:MAG: quinone oxidoreductase family protein [Ardenticatenaceae bacterium]